MAELNKESVVTGMARISETVNDLIEHCSNPPDDLTVEQWQLSMVLISSALRGLLNTAENLAKRLEFEMGLNEEIKRSMN